MPAAMTAPSTPLSLSDEKTFQVVVDVEERNDGRLDADDVPIDRKPEDSRDYPDGGYGWVIVACGFMINFSTWGINTAFGIYLSFDLEQGYYKDAKDIGQVLAGFSTKIWQLYLTQGVLFAIGLGLSMVVTGPIVTQWFGMKRAFAVGIVSAGSGGGALFYSNITRVTLETVGRRWACVINGCLSGAGMIPALLFFRTRATALKVRFEPFQPSFFKNPGFIGMCFWGMFISFAYAISIYTVPTYATQGLGLSQTSAATLQSLLAVGQIVGRPGMGFILDKVGRFNGAIATTLIACISCLAVWLVANSFSVLALAAFLQGASTGVFWSTCQALLTDLVGIRDMASALSMLWLSIVAPATVSAPIAIWLTNYSRNDLGMTGTSAFRYGIIFAGLAYFASAVSLYGTKRYMQGNWRLLTKT